MKNGLIIPIGLVSMLGLAIFSWGSTNNQVKTNTDNIFKIEQKIENLSKDIQNLQRETQQGFIRILTEIKNNPPR